MGDPPYHARETDVQTQDYPTWLALVVLVALALVVVGVVSVLDKVLGEDPKTLTIYSSLPLQGPEAKQSEDMVQAMRLALDTAGGKAGDFKIHYVSLDDATSKSQTFTAAAVAHNALTAVNDDHTAGYIGEQNSGATATAIPILSVAKIAQISPSSTAVGLTSTGVSADPDEPDSYYYRGFRNFVRNVPNDRVQAKTLVSLMHEDHCRILAMISDGGVYGRRLARDVRRFARQEDVLPRFDKTIGTRERRLPELAKRSNADCFLYTGQTSPRAVRVFTAIAYALSEARLYAPDGLIDTAFTDASIGGIPAAVAKRTKLTVPTLRPDEYGPPGKSFFDAYRARYGDSHPEQYAIYAYDAMSLMLDAIRRSRTGRREDIVKALFETRDRNSALGTYSIDANGDTDRRTYGVFRIANGQARFLRTVDAQP